MVICRCALGWVNRVKGRLVNWLLQSCIHSKVVRGLRIALVHTPSQLRIAVPRVLPERAAQGWIVDTSVAGSQLAVVCFSLMGSLQSNVSCFVQSGGMWLWGSFVCIKQSCNSGRGTGPGSGRQLHNSLVADVMSLLFGCSCVKTIERFLRSCLLCVLSRHGQGYISGVKEIDEQRHCYKSNDETRTS